jgi:hypothetical protein
MTMPDLTDRAPGLYEHQIIRLDSGEFLRWREDRWEQVTIGDNGQFVVVDEEGQIVGVGDE